MATVTVYFLNTAATSPNWFGKVQDNGTAPGGALSAFGWAVGKTAITTPYWRGRLGATGTASVASASSYIDAAVRPVQGTGAGATTAGDSFRSDNPLNGTFAAGNWNFTFGMRTATATTVGRIRLNVWASTNADGTGTVRKLNSSTLVGTIVTMSTTTTTYNSTVTWAAPQIVLANEYVFTQIEWQETTVGTANGCTAQFYQASFVTTDYVYDPATGTLARTETPDTAAMSGLVGLTGTLGTTEPIDDPTMAGTIPGGPAPTGEYLIAAWTPGTDRNDFTGWMGLRFTPSVNMWVNKLGLRFNTSNTGNHNVVLQKWHSSNCTTLRTAVIDLTGGTQDEFVYADIAPQMLAAGTSYTLTSQLTAGDGQYFAHQTAVTVNDAGAVQALYSYDTTNLGYADYAVNAMFVGLDLAYAPYGELVLDPAYTSTRFTLSNGNLTGLYTGTTGYGSTMSQPSSGTGKFYVEAIMDVDPALGNQAFGVASDASLYEGNWLGADASSVGNYNGAIYRSSGIAGTGPAVASGQRTAIAVDHTVSPTTVSFRNVTTASAWSTPLTITGTAGGALRCGFSAQVPGSQATFVFDNSIVGVPPAGYTKWDGEAYEIASQGTLATTEPSDTVAITVAPFVGTVLAGITTTSNITLSNGNLTATNTGAVHQYGTSLSQDNRGATKLYAEVVKVVAGADDGFGVANENTVVVSVPNAYIGGDASSVGLFSDGSIYNNNSVIATGPIIAQGQRLAVAFDVGAKTIAFRNVTTASAWTTVTAANVVNGGSRYSFGGSFPRIGNQSTFEFDGTFVGTPPDGSYTRWDGSAIAAAADVTGTLATTEPADAAGLTGLVATHYTLTATTGAFAIAGSSADLRVARVLQTTTGAFTLTGNNATLTYAPVSTGTTLEPSLTSGLITLSADKLTAEKTSAGGYVVSQSGMSGITKHYCEVICVADPGIGTDSNAIGVTVNDTFQNSWLGALANSIGYYSTGSIYCGGVLVTSTATIDIGDRIGIAVEWGTNKYVKFRNITKAAGWTSVISLSPVSSGGFHAAMSAYDVGYKTTFVFDSAFVGTPPDSGYVRWNGSAIAAGPTNYTLTATPGAFAIAGSSTDLRVARVLQATTGAFAITGYSTSLLLAYKLQATVGAFAITGYDVNLRAARVLGSSTGAFTITGYGADLRVAYKLQATTGEFVITGYPITMTTTGSYTLAAAAGAFTITGYDINLTKTNAAVHYTLTATAGAFTIAGSNATLWYGRVLTATPGAFAITGYPVDLRKTTVLNYTLTALPGAFEIIGNETGLTRGLWLKPATGSFVVTRNDGMLRIARMLNAQAGAIRIEGLPVDFVRTVRQDLVLEARTGRFEITGYTAGFYDLRVAKQPGELRFGYKTILKRW